MIGCIRTIFAAAVAVVMIAAGTANAQPAQDELGVRSVRPAEVRLRQDPEGWTLTVDGKPFYVKGVNWVYTPVGQKYDFDRWGMPREQLKRQVDEDARLMRSMGINAVRLTGDAPPEWISYLYSRYGIHTIVNDLAGRWGVTIDGTHRFPTDYSDPAVRAEILKRSGDYVRRYRNVPGVLAIAFGNEGNYGLEWTSGEIENLPTGERQAAKAKHLYTLLEAVAAQAKSIDPSHPVLFVNGDLQYLELIAKSCPSIDILGVNAYRGKDFGDLWRRVGETLSKPVLLMEFGCDAYNVRTGREDQAAQAEWMRAQLLDMQANARGGGGAGTCLGGMIFAFADEWWKFGQQTGLDVHDTQANWANGGYSFDFESGKNNMNEEWWGLCALQKEAVDGLNPRRPRQACQVVREIWLEQDK